MLPHFAMTKRPPQADRGAVAERTAHCEPADACGARSKAPALGAADWLNLAGAPTFAIMAMLAAVPGGGRPDIFCSAAQDASPASGMVTMYLLMSAFHLAPWLRLIANRQRGARRS